MNYLFYYFFNFFYLNLIFLFIVSIFYLLSETKLQSKATILILCGSICSFPKYYYHFSANILSIFGLSFFIFLTFFIIYFYLLSFICQVLFLNFIFIFWRFFLKFSKIREGEIINKFKLYSNKSPSTWNTRIN